VLLYVLIARENLLACERDAFGLRECVRCCKFYRMRDSIVSPCAALMYCCFVRHQRSVSEKLFDPTSCTLFFAPAPIAFTAALANAAL